MLINHLTNRDLEWFLNAPGTGTKITRYPLTNLGADKEGNLIVEVAIAGFKKEDIELELVGNQLLIRGTKAEDSESEAGVQYIQKHISTTSFSRIIVLHDKFVGGEVSAKMEDGILTITVVPKEQAKRLIAIS